MIRIKKLKPDDYKKFHRLFKQIIGQEFPEYSKYIVKHFSLTKYTKQMFDLHVKFGAFDGKKLIGYILGKHLAGGVFYIFWLSVDSEYQKMGIGGKLLYRIEKIALKRGFHSIQLNAYQRNFKFYRKKGYEVLGFDKKGYYGCDSYLMKKLIQEPKEISFFKV